MRWIRNFTVILILMWVVGACLKQPENSIIPQIQFQSVVFKKGDLKANPPIFDSLIVIVKFSDGDGDLGIDKDETAIYTSPVDSTDINTPNYYLYDTTKNIISYITHSNNLNSKTLPKGCRYVNYASRRKIHSAPFDTLPSKLTCKDWEIPSAPAATASDTLYKQDNPYNSNFFMDIYTKNPDGTYTYFDLNEKYSIDGCPATQNRFPILSSDLGKKSSVDGTITYGYGSVLFYKTFHGQTLNLKIHIMDRAFHKSNVVESGDFVVR